MEGQRLTPDRLRPTEGYSNPIVGSSPEGFAQYKGRNSINEKCLILKQLMEVN